MNVVERLAELATIGATPSGIDRALFSAAEHAARERFASWARADCFAVEQDRAGNVFVRLAGREALPPVQCGSHLDTVKYGGAYDGAYGVVGGLEALRLIAARAERPRHPIEVVAWAGEEGSRFPVGTLGSSVYAGITPYAQAEALVADDGERFADAFAGPHGKLAGVPVRDGFPAPAVYLELHIEQGPVMERAGARLGVVTAIAGQRRYAVTIAGVAGHAGTIPMALRSDALAAAAELVLAVEAAARAQEDSVATVGRLVVEPNQTNIVPGAVRLRIDARSVDDARIDAMERAVGEAAERIGQARRVRVTIEPLEGRRATPMTPALRAMLRSVCDALDPAAIALPSGAGHDAMCLAQIAPAAMIFVPSIGGESHVGTERTAPADLELGVEALAAALLAVDRDPALTLS
ncbi:MAG: M20 family metallo-hydrolase [Candidatus Velthaea sp.]